MNAKEYMESYLGDNMNIGSLTPLAIQELMDDYCIHKRRGESTATQQQSILIDEDIKLMAEKEFPRGYTSSGNLLRQEGYIKAMQLSASQFKQGYSREQMQGYVRYYLEQGGDVTIPNEKILDDYLNSLTNKQQ